MSHWQRLSITRALQRCFSHLKIESIICFHGNGSRRGAWKEGQLADFAYSSNTLVEDSQEYEDVESSQIYIPDSDETQIVYNENETVTRCEVLPRLCKTISASCTKRLDCFVQEYVLLSFHSWKNLFSCSFRFSVKLSYTSARGMFE